MTVGIRVSLVTATLMLSLPGCATTQQAANHDPWERFNRGMQRFNDASDRTVMKPVATGYLKHVPRVIRIGVNNLLGHLSFPTTIVNDLLQLKLLATAADIGRFALNSTLGIGGLLDPATRVGIPHNREDFGQTLGRWGVPDGPYLVLPVVGPLTLRDAASLLVDTQTDLRVRLHLSTSANVALGVLTLVDRRASFLSADEMLESAFDRYAFIRDAWLQRREYQVRDGDVPEEAPLEVEPEAP
jgi:phospholipid-binding lipoprotein MlaA